MRLDVAARAYLGVPFRHQGRNPAVGIDCVGLLVCAAADCGIPTEADRTDYGRDPAHGYLERQLRAAFGAPVFSPLLQPGDVVAIDFKGAIRHVAIVAERDGGGLNLIHTNFSVQRVTEAILDDRWRKRIRAVYRPETVL
jgi:cell wall-associated NlpC family hydrolase